ncbi:hypothetical protein DFP72DRAFT_393910 [Ephemerocybe angulata]|uniref:Uncharacterized protein n=1 Tax=Ephemerocybe angulata TaxID=980116 RepID=A0A8H6HVS8_9AGAR|nr:hypothetical protein DFP72DRAFT_393910 [Tulosesus angulatus]
MSNGSVRHRRSCGRRESSKKGKDDGRHHRAIERTKANNQLTTQEEHRTYICDKRGRRQTERNAERREEYTTTRLAGPSRSTLHTRRRPHPPQSPEQRFGRKADEAPSGSRLRTPETHARPPALFHLYLSPIEQPTHARTHHGHARTSNARERSTSPNKCICPHTGAHASFEPPLPATAHHTASHSPSHTSWAGSDGRMNERTKRTIQAKVQQTIRECWRTRQRKAIIDPRVDLSVHLKRKPSRV